MQEKYDLELTNKDDIIADLQNRLDTALRNDDFREKYVHLGNFKIFIFKPKLSFLSENHKWDHNDNLSESLDFYEFILHMIFEILNEIAIIAIKISKNHIHV